MPSPWFLQAPACSFAARGLAALRRLAWLLCLPLICSSVAAQTIESLQWLEGAKPAVARITFNANVRFLQQAPLALTDLVQLSFQIVAADDAVLTQSIEEGKRLAGFAGVPSMALTYVPAPHQAVKSLSLRFGYKVRALARQGPGARTIDLAFVNVDGASATLPEPRPLPDMAVLPAERR